MRCLKWSYIYLFFIFAKTNEGRRNIQVVIARYNENVNHLRWLSTLPHVIYNRGPEISHGLGLQVVQRYENVGRESFLYLDHILHNYDMLADLTVFSQAMHRTSDVFNFTNDHFEYTVKGLRNDTTRLHPLSDGFAYLLPICYNFDFGVKSWGFRRDNFFKRLLHFEVAFPRFGPTGCFAVERETILRNSKEYYAQLIRSINSENNPRVGHFIERAWPEVFHSNCSSSKNETSAYYCSIGNIPNDTCELRL
jgi:hypothetical protein